MLDENQACAFVKHLIGKWKFRNAVIIERYGNFLFLVTLDEFTMHLKAALNTNAYIKPFVK